MHSYGFALYCCQHIGTEETLGREKPRIIIFSGKGGVGKTTAAAATALRCAENGLKTIVISIDIAHSLSDAFQPEIDLHDHNRGQRRQINDNLWIQEVDIQEELDRHWGEVSKYLAALLGKSGITNVLAEELAIIPGMEDVVSLLYINQYYKEKTFDVIVIDCAPTGESLRFVSMPSTLEWYMKKIFKLERNLLKAARPIAKRFTDIPLPEDAYFASIGNLFMRLEGVDEVLLDREVTSVRLVTNAEKMVVRETQRAFMYFCLYGLVVDAIIVNRLFPQSLQDSYLKDWLCTQQRSLKQINEIFDPIPIRKVNILEDEVVGLEMLSKMGAQIYDEIDPSAVMHQDTVYRIDRSEDGFTLRIKLPFVTKDHVDLFQEDGDLVVRIGSFKRHVFMPRVLVGRKPGRASLENSILSVAFPGPA
ncbi:MAG: ArsA family ATPase [Desulfomonile tiedjei]|uniref:arsenite-transporting ATPase n=1 Tax=Desulfomonile tiedjei TaxID=2358 RepID=A0A9D6V4C7_9BACT|nr:ArsA family ATPase [Desulfomonile tiedjei]